MRINPFNLHSREPGGRGVRLGQLEDIGCGVLIDRELWRDPINRLLFNYLALRAEVRQATFYPDQC